MMAQKNAYVDVNPVIVIDEKRIVLAKRVKGIVSGGKWHLPGGRVLFNETIIATLKRIAFEKTNLKIELLYPTLRKSLVGIYDNPERDPRLHVISLAFLCKTADVKPKPGKKWNL